MSTTTLRTYDGTATEQTETEAGTEHATQDATQACPECGGSLAQDDARGETACVDCGLVVAEDDIDRGPEWRAFDSSEQDQKSRVGAPTTKMMHDKGLSTNIGWQDKDAYG
ncbi:MAG: TFIIB-type zinc ribbon-containing protein, partial [Halobacterium sp.]